MNQFFTLLPHKKQDASIRYTSTLFLIGSCFVENIGEKLAYHKFPTLINPFGIIFHPEAISPLLLRIVHQNYFTESDLFYHNEQWHCFEVHSQLSHTNKKECLNQLNSFLKDTHNFLKNTSHILITYGSAWGYEQQEQVVANCHKVPQKEFNKKLTSVTAIQHTINITIEAIKKINPKASIIFTVSPVRHIKDGIIENNQSKAHLLTAVHQVIQKTTNTFYYPAYELVMDCLRDYRFYKPDLIHPNETAINFIWEHFQQTWLHESETQKTLKQVAEIQRGLHHKPFNKNSEAHKKFMASLSDKIERLTDQYSFINF